MWSFFKKGINRGNVGGKEKEELGKGVGWGGGWGVVREGIKSSFKSLVMVRCFWVFIFCFFSGWRKDSLVKERLKKL